MTAVRNKQITFTRTNVSGNTPEGNADRFDKGALNPIVYTTDDQRQVQLSLDDVKVEKGVIVGLEPSAASKLQIAEEDMPTAEDGKNDNRIAFKKGEKKIGFTRNNPLPESPAEEDYGMTSRDIAMGVKAARNANRPKPGGLAA